MIVHFTNDDHAVVGRICQLTESDTLRGRHILEAFTVMSEDRPFHDPSSDLNDLTERLLLKMKTIFPERYEMVHDVIKSRGIQPWQYLLGMLFRSGDLFELGDPMEIRDLMSDDGEPKTAVCGYCSVEFQPTRPGQAYCSNKCGATVEAATSVTG